MRFAALIPAIACAALAACSTLDKMGPPPFARSEKCPTAQCPVIQVTVTESGTSCEASVSIPVLDVSTGPALKDLEWKIITQGYEFSREEYKWAIYIRDDLVNEFKGAQVQGSDVLRIKFERRAAGLDYKYDLNVRRSSGTKAFCRTLDPWLIS